MRRARPHAPRWGIGARRRSPMGTSRFSYAAASLRRLRRRSRTRGTSLTGVLKSKRKGSAYASRGP